MMNIRIKTVKNKYDLYCRYEGQDNPQAVYLKFDPEDNLLSAEYDPDNLLPPDLRHRRVCRWYFDRPVLADVANTTMTNIRELAQRVAAGYSCEWDGHNNIGEYTDDAQEAIDTVREMIRHIGQDESTGVVVWDAGEQKRRGETQLTFEELQARFPDRVLIESEWHQHARGGGWVENTATVSATAYVSRTAVVSDEATVYEHAFVMKHSIVSGAAQILEHTIVKQHAHVSGHAKISDHATILEHASDTDYADIVHISGLLIGRLPINVCRELAL